MSTIAGEAGAALNCIFLSIVVPLFNEDESVEELVARIVDVGGSFEFAYEIILVDDGSRDRTWEIIERLANVYPVLRGIKLRRNCGQTPAMVAGFDNAKGEVIVTLDGDLQNDPADIPLLLGKMAEGYDIVSGWRVDRKDHSSRVLPSRVANAIISRTTGVHLHDYGCSLKAYRAECIKCLQAYGEMHRFFPALASMTGAHITEVPVNHQPRKHGVSKYGFDRIFKVFCDIFTINLIAKFSSNPLKGFALSSIPFFSLSLFFGVLCASALAFQWTEGKALFFMVSCGLGLMAAVHLIVLGLLAELVVNVSDLSHTQLLKLTKKSIDGELTCRQM